MKIKHISSFVNGNFVKTNQIRPLISPVTERPYCNVEDATEDTINAAIKSSRKVFEPNSGINWANSSATAFRRNSMLAIADALDKNADELAMLESLSGKPLQDSKSDANLCSEVFRHFSGYCDKIYGKEICISDDIRSSAIVEPIGTCALITSYNYPLSLVTWKLAPALAAGNAVVIKPHELTPLSTLFLAKLINESTDIPKEVISVLVGSKNVGEYLSKSMDVDKLSFTGSGGVGKKVMTESGSSNFKNVTLELGGKSPMIVMPDCDLLTCVEDVVSAIFSNMGQNCCAGSRLYIHMDIYDRFLDILKSRVSRIKIGDPLDINTEYGPLIDKIQFEKVLNYIEQARNRGLKLLTGGNRRGDLGYYVQPTIFYDVDDTDPIICEEVFGPVLAIAKPFTSFDEVIKRANDSIYGLAGAIWTKDYNVIERSRNMLKVGTLWINCYNLVDPRMPFGGLKMSGIGYDLGPEAITQEYTKTRVVYQKFNLQP